MVTLQPVTVYPLIYPSPTVLAPGTGFVQDNFSIDSGEGGGGGWNSGGNVSDVTCLLLTSYCVARLLAGPGLGTPALIHNTGFLTWHFQNFPRG